MLARSEPARVQPGANPGLGATLARIAIPDCAIQHTSEVKLEEGQPAFDGRNVSGKEEII